MDIDKEYIDVELVKEHITQAIQEMCEDGLDEYISEGVIELFNDLPTVTKSDIISHGYWAERATGSDVFDYRFICSECGNPTPNRAYRIAPDFCPSCGAIMDMREPDISCSTKMDITESDSIRHGYWIERSAEGNIRAKFICSECEKANDAYFTASDFCPHCGAKMDRRWT